MSAAVIDARDLSTARAIHARAVAALGPLSVGAVTDLLADRQSWRLTYCHAIAHALVPGACGRSQPCDIGAHPSVSTAAALLAVLS